MLYYSKDMETFATGLKRIKDLCDEAGCKVDFRTEKEDFVVVFYRNLRETWNIGAKSDANLDANGANSGVKNTENVLAVKTIELIKKNPKTTQVELAAELNVSRRTIQRLMAELARNGKIQRIGGTRGEWIAK